MFAEEHHMAVTLLMPDRGFNKRAVVHDPPRTDQDDVLLVILSITIGLSLGLGFDGVKMQESGRKLSSRA